MAAMRRFFLKVNTTIQEKSVTPVRNPISDRMVTYSLYESLNFVVPNRMVNTIRICDAQELFYNINIRFDRDGFKNQKKSRKVF